MEEVCVFTEVIASILSSFRIVVVIVCANFGGNETGDLSSGVKLSAFHREKFSFEHQDYRIASIIGADVRPDRIYYRVWCTWESRVSLISSVTSRRHDRLPLIILISNISEDYKVAKGRRETVARRYAIAEDL